MVQLPRHPAVWISALLCWFGILWFLSSLQGSSLPAPWFPQFDKVEHFGYFLGGGFILTGFNFYRKPQPRAWKTILATSIIIIATIGFIDEWHQCYTPNRSGADPWDWLADLLGGTAGAFLLKTIQRWLQ